VCKRKTQTQENSRRNSIRGHGERQGKRTRRVNTFIRRGKAIADQIGRSKNLAKARTVKARIARGSKKKEERKRVTEQTTGREKTSLPQEMDGWADREQRVNPEEKGGRGSTTTGALKQGVAGGVIDIREALI